MKKSQWIRLLFIDPHEEWLSFVESTLADLYDVCVAKDFEVLYKAQEGQFDLIFVGLNLAQENMDVLSHLAQSSRWHFIVLFPGFPDGKTARILFKAGMRDLLGKPYDPESLRDMVKHQIAYVRERNKPLTESRDSDDYESQVHRLWEFVRAETLTRL